MVLIVASVRIPSFPFRGAELNFVVIRIRPVTPDNSDASGIALCLSLAQFEEPFIVIPLRRNRVMLLTEKLAPFYVASVKWSSNLGLTVSFLFLFDLQISIELQKNRPATPR